MGCFSYICKNCGKSIKEDEGVKLFVLQEGKLMEEMEGNYSMYGDVNNQEWENDFDDILNLHWSRHRDDGIAAIHSKCWNGVVPTTRSEDDPKQGVGKMTTSKTNNNSHVFYEHIMKSKRMEDDDKKLKEMGDNLAKVLAEADKILKQFQKQSDKKR
jgi:hypothetical protein